jgi:hypothetical protein
MDGCMDGWIEQERDEKGKHTGTTHTLWTGWKLHSMDGWDEMRWMDGYIYIDGLMDQCMNA